LLIRIALGVVLFLACGFSSRAAEQGQLDASPSLFSVMAAINAAGYDADLNSASNSPLRDEIRKELAARQIACLPDLKSFFAKHKQKDWTAELSQYVSFALSVDGPPNFASRFRPNEIPPDVATLSGFDELMAKFYKEANLEQLWRKSQPAFEAMIERYHGPSSRALLEVNAFLRNPTSGYLGRRFQIYVDLLAAPNNIQTRSYKDDYFVVVTPSAEPQGDDVRHGYLHYLLDPLAIKYSDRLAKKQGLIDYAQGAPFLEDHYKSDFLLLATECLIKAIESRLAPGGLEKKQALVAQALGEGFVMTPYFAEALPAYEKQEQSMRFYFPDMVDAVDLRKEEKRLENIQFATERPVRKAKMITAERKIELTGPHKTLQTAEEQYEARQFEPARQGYLKALQESDDKALHAKSYYGLARIALRENTPEVAEQMLHKVLEAQPDPQTRAWAHVYLGRLADAAGDREQATRHYGEASKIEGASPAARQAAEKGLGQAFTRPKQPN
jgi:predicted negative regulator of RcsB-dependent stress response